MFRLLEVRESDRVYDRQKGSSRLGPVALRISSFVDLERVSGIRPMSERGGAK